MASMSDEKLGTQSIPKLLLTLGLPGVAAQFINMLYNIVDRIYIGNIPDTGAMALTGVGVCFPIIMIISAFGAFAGMGGAPLASIRLGRGERKEAEKILGNCFSLVLILSVLLTVFFQIFKEPVLYAFGASGNSVGYGLSYIEIYLYGTVFVQIALGLNTFISAQGNATTAMLSVLIGAVLNIALDPVFIFTFGMGVRGAALATVLSQAASAAWVLWFLMSRKSGIRIRRENMRLSASVVKKVSGLGIAPFIMQSTESLVQITLNSGLQRYGGDLYVGSMTILLSVMQVFSMPMQGFTQGAQPILSYNFGAKKFDRVNSCFRMMFISALCFGMVFCLLVWLFPTAFARLFSSDPELVELTARKMPIFVAGMSIFGMQSACQSFFMGLGQAKTSMFIALLRKVFLLIPLALIFPVFWGVEGIYAAEPVADFTAATTTALVWAFRHKAMLYGPHAKEKKT